MGLSRFPQVFCGFLWFLSDFGHKSENLRGFSICAANYRAVEELDHRGCEAEARGDFLEQRGFGCGLCGECGGKSPLAAEDEVEGGRVCGKASRRALEFVAFELVHGCAEFAAGEQRAQFLVVIEQIAAHGEQLFGRGHVHAGCDDDFLGADVEVEAGAGGFLQSAADPPGGDVVLVGLLWRAAGLVEAGVAIDAEHGFVGRSDVLWREVCEGVVDVLDEGEHGGFEFALEDGLAWIEPCAVVVAGEAAEEFEGFGSEVSGHGSYEFSVEKLNADYH